jgi:hypothetical protein
MDLIVIGALYVAVFGLFHRVGGLAGAADVFESWGRASASARPTRLSPSS